MRIFTPAPNIFTQTELLTSTTFRGCSSNLSPHAVETGHWMILGKSQAKCMSHSSLARCESQFSFWIDAPNRSTQDKSTLLRCFLCFFLLQLSQHVSDRRLSKIYNVFYVLTHVFEYFGDHHGPPKDHIKRQPILFFSSQFCPSNLLARVSDAMASALTSNSAKDFRK